MNKYELTVVFDGKAGAAKKKKFAETLEGLLKVYKGKVLETTDRGVKDLAYKIDKSVTGLYLYFVLELDGKGVKALNDKLRVDGEIIRFLIVRNG